MLDRDFFFSFEGRAPRSEYWLFVGISIAYAFLVGIAVVSTVGFPRPPDNAVSFRLIPAVLTLPLLWPSLAVSVRRLHDRNKGRSWGWLFVGIPAAWTWMDILRATAGTNAGVLAYLFSASDLAAFAISLWAIVELGFLRGTEGDNRFGSDPLPPVVRLPSGEKVHQGLPPGGHRVRLAVRADDGRVRNEFYYVAESDPERARIILRDAKGARDEDVKSIDAILHETVERLKLAPGAFAPVPRVG